jgi:hypothetical protein
MHQGQQLTGRGVTRGGAWREAATQAIWHKYDRRGVDESSYLGDAKMVTVHLFVDSNEAALERQWPAVPRVGETLILLDRPGELRVTDVVWAEYPGGRLSARVHLKAHTETDPAPFIRG